MRRQSRLFTFTVPWLKGRRIDSVSDADLIAGCLAGDAAAWDALIERYAPLINTVTIRMGLCAEDGADILQDVSLQLYQHLDDLRDHVRLSAWLITVTRRAAWRLRKRHGLPALSAFDERQIEGARPLHVDEPEPPETSLIQLAEHEEVRQSVGRLPELCRRLLTLLYFRDPAASYAQAAVELKLAEGSIGPNRARCLQKLRKLLEDHAD